MARVHQHGTGLISSLRGSLSRRRSQPERSMVVLSSFALGAERPLQTPVSHKTELVLYSLPFSAINIINIPPSSSPFHCFIIARHLDLRRKTTANESMTVLPSQPPILQPSRRFSSPFSDLGQRRSALAVRLDTVPFVSSLLALSLSY